MEYILSLNCGTSSAKYAVWERATRNCACRGIVERVGSDDSYIRHETTGHSEVRLPQRCPDHITAIGCILDVVTGRYEDATGVLEDLGELVAVGQRVVHGGQRLRSSVPITEAVYRTIADTRDFAPLHIPANLAGIDAIRHKFPDVPQIAVFDTAFLQSLPRRSYLYGAPYAWYEKYGVRKYGFHGTSHLYLTHRVSALLDTPVDRLNLVTLHIGNGISITAIRNGKPVEHSMGMTPLDGVMMGTRSGTIDPAVVALIADKEGRSARDVVDTGLNRESGLYGYTGFTDMRDILRGRAGGDERCVLAFELYCYKMKLFFGACLGVLDFRVDAVVFSGGVGENVKDVRTEVLDGFDRAGIAIDDEKNRTANAAAGERDISAEESRTRVFVIPTNEEMVLLEDVIGILDGTFGDPVRFRYSFGR